MEKWVLFLLNSILLDIFSNLPTNFNTVPHSLSLKCYLLNSLTLLIKNTYIYKTLKVLHAKCLPQNVTQSKSSTNVHHTYDSLSHGHQKVPVLCHLVPSARWPWLLIHEQRQAGPCLVWMWDGRDATHTRPPEIRQHLPFFISGTPPPGGGNVIR